jgi:hypothetical protein
MTIRWSTPLCVMPASAKALGPATRKAREEVRSSTDHRRLDALAGADEVDRLLREIPRARTPPGSARHRRSGILKAASWAVRARRVDVEIDDFDAGLGPVVGVTGMPRSIAESNISYPREPEATPLTSWRQTLLAFTAKLIGQGFFLPLRAAENDGAKLARAPIVRAEDLFPAGHRLFKQLVSGAWRPGFRHRHGRAVIREHSCRLVVWR